MGDQYTITAPSQLYSSTPKFPRYVNSMVLGAGTAESYTPPAWARFSVITSNGSFYARLGGTAAIPTTEVADGTSSFLVQAGMQVCLEGGAALSLIRAGSSSVVITIAHYG